MGIEFRRQGDSEGRDGPLGRPRTPAGIASPNASDGRPSGPSLPQRKPLSHGIPPWVKGGAVFFITICCKTRTSNQLCVPQIAGQIFEAVEFRQIRGDWHVHLFVLMPDHLHILVSFSREEAMKRVVSNFKEITAKKIDIEWQREFFDHRLRSDESLDEKAFYLRMNPVRKGLVSRPEEWPYVWPSSFTDGPAVRPYL